MGIEVFWKRKPIERKERSDKKQQVAPTISKKLKKEIERLAFITDQPVKRIGELLTYEGIHNREVTEKFAPYFQRGILRVGATLFYGSKEKPSIQNRIDTDPTDRISIRFEQQDFEDIRLLANLLDVSPTKAVALLLDASFCHPEIVEYILHNFMLRNPLEEKVISEIRKLMRYVNKHNSYRKARWNVKFERHVNDTEQSVKKIMKLSPNSIDTETYKWDLD